MAAQKGGSCFKNGMFVKEAKNPLLSEGIPREVEVWLRVVAPALDAPRPVVDGVVVMDQNQPRAPCSAFLVSRVPLST